MKAIHTIFICKSLVCFKLKQALYRLTFFRQTCPLLALGGRRTAKDSEPGFYGLQ